MTLGTALATFALVTLALTLTPGLDSALVLRSALTKGRREAVATGAGIISGLFVWGAAAAVGVSALLTASHAAYDVLRFVGAAYLVWFGVRLVMRALRRDTDAPVADVVVRGSAWRAARQGLATNLPTPRVGVFYSALFPQSIPPHDDPWAGGLLLAGEHGLITVVWFAVLILLASALGRRLRRPSTVRAIDGVTGTALLGFGLELALSDR